VLAGATLGLAETYGQEAFRSSVDLPQVGYFGSVLVGLISGKGFGYGLAKSRCIEPHALRGQMLMQNMLMMKLFMGCCVTSLLAVNVFRALHPEIPTLFSTNRFIL
jgi:hypothetical protein